MSWLISIGFYAQVNSAEDARNRAVDYALVMARPMVLYQADHPIHWSPVFLGGTSGNIGFANDRKRRLVTTVSIPVFDRRNHSTREANLLGVAGADVSIEEIIKMIPQYKVNDSVVLLYQLHKFLNCLSMWISSFQLGANGYSFIVDNNGKILHHPDLRLPVIILYFDINIPPYLLAYLLIPLNVNVAKLQKHLNTLFRVTECNTSTHYVRITAQPI